MKLCALRTLTYYGCTSEPLLLHDGARMRALDRQTIILFLDIIRRDTSAHGLFKRL
jgi:hypothetical protein